MAFCSHKAHPNTDTTPADLATPTVRLDQPAERVGGGGSILAQHAQHLHPGSHMACIGLCEELWGTGATQVQTMQQWADPSWWHVWQPTFPHILFMRDPWKTVLTAAKARQHQPAGLHLILGGCTQPAKIWVGL